MPEKVTSFYICPWSLRDPLCQSQSLAYIDQLTAEGYSFALMTLETSKFALAGGDEIRAVQERLRKRNIFWYPVNWQTGNSIFDKVSGMTSALSTGLKVCRRHRPQIIHTRSSLPAFLGVALAKFFRLRYLYDADSILSEEYADTNHLTRDSLGFKMLAQSEAAARSAASEIIVLTEKLKDDYREKFGVQKPIEVIPCCVDTENFRFDAAARSRRRGELRLSGELLFIYVGKMGSWYLVEETVDFFKAALAADRKAKMLIVTTDEPAAFEKLFREKGVPAGAFFIKSAAHREVPEWLSAADVGVALIKPLPSKRGSSPVKTSEYLACGLPVVANAGIGDLDAIIERENAGVVLTEFNGESYAAALIKTFGLLQNNNLREICRRAAHRYFDLKAVGGARYRRLYERILSPRQ